MGVAYGGISSGSALFARRKQFKDRGASFCINFDQQPFEEKKIDYSVLVAIHQKMKGVKINCSR